MLPGKTGSGKPGWATPNRYHEIKARKRKNFDFRFLTPLKNLNISEEPGELAKSLHFVGSLGRGICVERFTKRFGGSVDRFFGASQSQKVNSRIGDHEHHAE